MNEEKARTTDGARHAPQPTAISSGAPRRVMVCLDGSPLSEACVPYAGFMARVLGAELTLLQVIPSPTEGVTVGVDVLNWEISRREAEQYLARVRGDIEASGVAAARIHTELTQGQSAHGATCNASEPFGSVTAHALAHAVLPLLVVQDLSRDGPRWDSPATSNDCPEGRSSIPSHRGPS